MANWLSNTLARFRPQGFGTVRPEDPNRTLKRLPLPVHSAGIPLTMDTATQLAVVWACMDAITKGIAASQWKVFQVTGLNRLHLPDDQLDYILNVRPNPEMTAIAWREAMLYQALSWGNSYTEIVRTGAGKPAELWPLLSDRMIVTRTLPPQVYETDPTSTPDLVYWYNQPVSGVWVPLKPSQVLHFRGPSINGLMGENMVARGAKAIGVAVAQEAFAGAYFGNNASLGTILKYPKTLSADAHKRLKEDWAEQHQGPNKAHKPFILEGGMELENLTANSQETQLVESRKFSVEEICRFFGVPPHKVQHLERATFNNIEHLGIEFVRDALTPWAQRLQQEVDFKLLPQKAPWRVTKLDMEWLSQGDAKSRWEGYAVGRRIGVLSANDILQKEGQNTIGPEGDIRVIEANMTPLRRMGEDSKRPEIFQYHITSGIPTVNEVRERLDLPPRADGDVPTGPATPALPPGAEPPEGPEEGAPPKEGGTGTEGAGALGEGKATPPKEGGSKPKEAHLLDGPLGAALGVLFASSLERYARKASNRERDLRRKQSRSEAHIQAALAEHRAETRVVLQEEMAEGFGILAQTQDIGTEQERAQLVAEVADAVDNGAPPHEAAATMVAIYKRS
jgi:HK97 family phage portal protein